MERTGKRLHRIAGILLALILLPLSALPGLAEAPDEIEEEVILEEDGREVPVPAETEAPEAAVVSGPREDFIDEIIALGQKLYKKANGKAQRAQYKSDIYICKNFTVYLFRQTREKYRMAEFPDVPLVIPDNLPSKQCRPYYYGILWKDIPASEGNPFYIAAEFRYDTSLSREENMELALAFMREVKRGDFFQMSADYEYGNGAHSAVMIADYDPYADTVRWMDSNMRGGKRNGVRYGLVQFDEEKEISWWAEAFCKKKRGATLYRLRDDIIFAGGQESK